MSKLKRAAPWAAAESLISSGATLLSTLVIARLLSPENFGQAAIAIALIQTIQIFTLAGIPQAIIRNEDASPALTDQLFWIMLILGILGTSLGWLVAAPVASFYGDPLLFLLIGVQSLDCTLAALIEFPTALLTRKMRTRSLAVRMLGMKIAAMIASVSVAIAGGGAWALVAGILTGSLVSVVLLWRTQPRFPRWRKFTPQCFAPMRFGLLYMVESAMGMVAIRGFMLLFGKFHGLHDLGLLNFALRLLDEMAMLITSSVGRLSLAFFASLRRQGRPIGPIYLDGTFILMTAIAPTFLGFASVAPLVVPLVFGEQWVPAVPTVQLLTLFWCLQLTMILSAGMLRAHQMQIPLLINAGVTILFAFGAVILTRHDPFVVTVAAFSARILFTWPITAYSVRNALRIPFRNLLKVLVPPLTSAAIMALAVVFLLRSLPEDLPTLIQIGIACASGVAIYAALMALLERQHLIMAFGKLRSIRQSAETSPQT